MDWFPSNSKKVDSPAMPIRKTLASLAVLSTSFFTLQNLSQRIAGKVGLFAGRALPITITLGLAITSMNMYASNYAALEFENVWDREIEKVPLHKVKKISTKDVVRRSFLGLGAYVVLENGLFRTVFPSSSITLGAYANTRSMLRSSIVSNSPVASEAQRRRIQEMGKRFGCHQCGSRQIFSKKGFIADHMPPTKRAEELTAKWWRRALNLKVNQRLWPQCQKCYSVQGSAVRKWTHTLIYHKALRLHHFAPVAAFILDQSKEIRDVCDDLLHPVVGAVEDLCKSINENK